MAAAQQLCNSLPISIRSACTKRDFKQKLKTFLFSKAFSNCNSQNNEGILLSTPKHFTKATMGD
ncbi:hypothetical protein pdam_00008061 [Pocillopora damicornis]|uniref:Uncharacterized protein n=1 Tax=Pocillopora damicornis TaxID=46731 RepID=A0A3M6TE39_POCDA|nr:hypothetical protein pdam_00008061 [Pocillopora damicornis]